MTVRGHGTKSNKSSWPDCIHESHERVEAAKQRLIDIAAGDSPEAVLGLRLCASPSEIALFNFRQDNLRRQYGWQEPRQGTR